MLYFGELRAALELSAKRILQRSRLRTISDERGVGKKMLPTNVGGLLVHCADHTQRHDGTGRHYSEGCVGSGPAQDGE